MLRSCFPASITLVCLALGACSAGGGDQPGAAESSTADRTTVLAEQARVGRLADDLAGLYAGDHPDRQDVADGSCFANTLLESLDSDDLRTAGLIGADGRVAERLPVFDQGLAVTWVDAQLACVDYVDASARAFVAQSKGALDVGAFTSCLRSALSDDEIRSALVQTLTGGFSSPEVRLLSTTQADCAD